MNKAKRIDRIKNLVIALLLVSALCLLYQAVFYETASTASLSDGGETQSGSTASDAAALSAKPVYILATGRDGTHTAAKYGREAREKLLGQFSAPLGEALGSAGNPKQVSAAEWQRALAGSGVYFDYLYPQPLSLIASSLGTVPTGVPGDVLSRRLCLSVTGNAVSLYYLSTADGTVFRCSTALSAASLSAKLGDYQGGRAKFAFESGENYAALDPYFIFSGEDATLAAVSASDPLTESGELSRLFDAFGMSSRASAGYIEKGGSVVYVESEKSLRVNSGTGSVLFSVTGKNGVAIAHSSSLTTAEMISACADIAKRSVGSTAGVAELSLSSCVSNEAAGETDISFVYSVGGTPVTLQSASPAASFKVSNGMIVRAELYFRRYSYTGETLGFLPEAQAAAIAQADGGEPVLTYNDSGDGTTVSWIVQ